MIAEPAEREALAARIRAEASARAANVRSPGARAMLLKAAENRAERVLAGLPVDLYYLRAAASPTPRPTLMKRDQRLADRPVTRRPCLRCSTPFDSHGPGNRLCTPCRARSAEASPYAL